MLDHPPRKMKMPSLSARLTLILQILGVENFLGNAECPRACEWKTILRMMSDTALPATGKKTA